MCRPTLTQVTLSKTPFDALPVEKPNPLSGVVQKYIKQTMKAVKSL